MEPNELLDQEDKYDFASSLFIHLIDKEPDLTPLQEKFYTCHWVISQYDNGGLTGMLYNADDRENWCRKVSMYCRELQADRSAQVFGDIAPIFSLPETEGSTWGEYLERADLDRKLDKMSTFDPNDDLFGALVSFAQLNRRELVLG